MSDPAPAPAPPESPAPPEAGAPRRPSRRSLLLMALWLGALYALQLWWQDRAATQAGARLAALAAPGDIRMLASDTCAPCLAARRWLQAHAVPFSECSIERDPACRADFAASGSPGTPVLRVRGRTLVGFDPAAIEQVLQAPR